MANYKLSPVELERVHAWCRRENTRFENGLFLSDNDDIKGILGYDTVLEFMINFKDAEEYTGPACLSMSSRSEILDSPVELPEKKETGYNFEKLAIPEKGLDFRIRISANHLDEPPIQGPLRDFYSANQTLMPAKSMKKIPEVEGLLDKYGVKTGNFGWNEVYAILEGMKEFEYCWGQGWMAHSPSKFVQQKKGVCSQFAQLFCHLVYGAGGISRLKRTMPLLNLKSMGRDIFLASGESGARHEWAEVYLDSRFQVVDPTFYVNTSKGYWKESEEFWDNLAQRCINGYNHAYVLGGTAGIPLHMYKQGQNLAQKITEIREA